MDTLRSRFAERILQRLTEGADFRSVRKGEQSMDPRTMWLVIAIVVIVVAAAGWYWTRTQRTRRLRRRFGPEYDRTVHQEGDLKRGEAALEARARRVERLHIRSLNEDDQRRYRNAWTEVQTRFVDDPKGAVTEADRLVGEVMNARGYPVGEFERRVEDVSVDHPNVVMNYRAAREIADQHAAGRASTEDLRQAMVHYRALFSELLGTRPTVETIARPREAAPRSR